MSSVWCIAVDYVKSLKSAKSEKFKLTTLLFQLGVPLGCGILAGVTCVDTPGTSEIVTGVSIVAALLCGVAILLFQTRIDMRKRFEDPGDPFLVQDDLKLVDELFSQVMWSILSGFLLVLLLILKTSFESGLAGCEILSRVGSGVAWCLIVNFVFTVGVVLKRTRRIYSRIAKGERNE